ncbi:MAG: hypothetical protein P8Z49_00995 [Acidobacteriota bacterium]
MTGEIEEDGGVLIIRRIHVVYHLAVPVDAEQRETVKHTRAAVPSIARFIRRFRSPQSCAWKRRKAPVDIPEEGIHEGL